MLCDHCHKDNVCTEDYVNETASSTKSKVDLLIQNNNKAGYWENQIKIVPVLQHQH